MSVTREARHLSGNDLGKTITKGRVTGTIGAITHHDGFARVMLDPPMADGTHTLSVLHHVTVTITGQPGPHTENPHGLQVRSEPEWASLYRPLGFTTVDEALGSPGPAELPDGPECCIGECCGPGSYCCGHPANKHTHPEEATDTGYRPIGQSGNTGAFASKPPQETVRETLEHAPAPTLPVPADKPVAHPPAIPVYNVGYHGTRLDTRFVAGMYRVPAHDGEAARAIVRRRLKEQGLKDVGIEYTTRQDRP